MGNLFRLLNDRVDANARRAVAAYAREIDEYRVAATDRRARAELLDVAVALRRRTIALAADDHPFGDDDLAFIAAVGRQRGELGVSLASQQRVLALHSSLTLQEVDEAAGSKDNEALLRMLAWLGSQGTAAHEASMGGYLEGQRLYLPLAGRMRQLATTLLADDPSADQLARGLGVPRTDHYVVAVVRLARSTGQPDDAGFPGSGDDVVEALLKRWPVPMSWHRPDELVVLAPAETPRCLEATAEDRLLPLARELAGMTQLPVAAGAVPGASHALGHALDLAREISHAAPLQAAPDRVHTLADVFVELGIARSRQVDDWLRQFAGRLAGGPDLVATLDAYYRNDMHRLRTAAALNVHPRTLDYRLQRVRELTGLDAGSTHGVRTLSAAVTRILAGGWI